MSAHFCIKWPYHYLSQISIVSSTSLSSENMFMIHCTYGQRPSERELDIWNTATENRRPYGQATKGEGDSLVQSDMGECFGRGIHDHMQHILFSFFCLTHKNPSRVTGGGALESTRNNIIANRERLSDYLEIRDELLTLGIRMNMCRDS